MVRAPVVDKDGVKRGAWSLQEDDKLRAYVLKYGPSKWSQVSTLAGLTRCGKSCRLRWLNYLRPGIKRGSYTKEENDLICKLHQKHGNRWSTIAEKLSGRTDNEIKNYWNAHLKKEAVVKPEEAATSCQQLKPKPKQLGLSRVVETKTEEFRDYCSSTFGIVESSSYSSQHEQQTSSCDDNFMIPKCAILLEHNDDDQNIISGYEEDLWTEPFIWDNINNYNNVANDVPSQWSQDYEILFSPQHQITYDDEYIDLFCSSLL